MVQLTETAVSMIETELKAQFPTVLTALRALRTDAKVSTEEPKSYFRWAGAMTYRCPAVFTIADSFDLMNAARGSNIIAGQHKITVSVVVEDRIKDNLVTKAYRYQAALHKILHLTSLTSSDGKVRLLIKVERHNFSPEFSESTEDKTPQSVFRKEVALELDVEHNENL